MADGTDQQAVPITPYPNPWQQQQAQEYIKLLQNPAQAQLKFGSPLQGINYALRQGLSALNSGGMGQQMQAARQGLTADALSGMPQGYIPGQAPPGTNQGRENAPSDTSSASPDGALAHSSKGGSNAKGNNALDQFVIDKMMPATKTQESGGNYHNVTTTKNKQGQPQSALGAYGIMDFNVGPWSKELLGREVSPQEFLSNPGLQDAIYRGKMAQYVSKYGVEGAGRAWLGGEGAVNHPERTDPLGTSVGSYGQHTARLVNKGVMPSELAIAGAPSPGMPSAPPSSLLAFNGQPADIGPGGAGQAAINMALQGGTKPLESTPPMQLAAGRGAPGVAAPAPPPIRPLPGPQVVPGAAGPPNQVPAPPPGAVPPVSTFTKEQLARILSAPEGAIDPALKAAALQYYMGTQVNPRSVPVTGGHYVVSPDGKTQWYVPDLQKGTAKAGDVEAPLYQTLPPLGPPPIGTPPAAPPAAPAQRPVPTGPFNTIPVKPGELPGGGSGVLGPQGALPAPTTVGAAQPALPPVQPPVRLAAASPATMTDATPAGAGAVPPMGASGPPPVPPPAPPVPPTAVAGGPSMLSPTPVTPQGIQSRGFIPSAPPPAATPSGGAPSSGLSSPLLPPGMIDLSQELKQRDMLREAEKSGLIASNASYAKKYETLQDQAAAANLHVGQLKIAQKLVQDPKTRQGLLANPQLFWDRMTDAFGLTKDAATNTQLLRKIISDSILEGLRGFTQGASVGQIRTAEIQLANRAAASTENNPNANLALLNIALKLNERAVEVANQAAEYKRTHGNNLDPGFDKQMLDYARDHPLFSNKEIYQDGALFEPQPAAGATPAAGSMKPGSYTYDPATKTFKPSGQ
jgi:hypothetical protein